MREAILLLIWCVIAALVVGFRPERYRPARLWMGIIAGLLAVLLLSRMWVEIPPGHVGVKFDPFAGGIQERELGEGWSLVLPWQTVQLFNVRTQQYTMSSARDELSGSDDAMTCQTREGLKVIVDVTVLFRISGEGADRLWRSVGPNYVNTIVRPATRNVVRLVIARYGIMEVYSNAPETLTAASQQGIVPYRGRRQQVEDEIYAELKPKLEEKGITLERVLLRNVAYESQEFEQAIVAKQVAQQAVITQQYKLRIAEIQAQAQVERAKGTAEAIRLRGQALRQNSAVVGLEFVQKLPQEVEVRILPGGTVMMMPTPAGALPASTGAIEVPQPAERERAPQRRGSGE
ncbi:MAG: prohibitin family protein [Armatimonadota bacterium]|nr:prohibitin family protein [bacterium]MDW8320261.1 prohibitin family protein [Armatimonadota bacterium]